MSATDIVHNSIKSALQKDGWTITHDVRTNHCKYLLAFNIFISSCFDECHDML
ncbi:MAG TPA: hypothetical protein DEG17_00760 [Cyanobacteria bacterium UBA11149]|nr:hypothetical protein [Cyanobacteria bacterium UBA11366]HBK64331.1 hypothetical protein [Cyanobacteria bacterium UBA11166]HBR75791.1 hypothetical protein [Cyanobacteria bacterium UBA11159]HBW87444.1 hypothetical protein [Cyanobacteria bacterium UBA11149]HCA97694.1 hypothetical protein [Cyanobacteria bacterium UBA9226]